MLIEQTKKYRIHWKQEDKLIGSDALEEKTGVTRFNDEFYLHYETDNISDLEQCIKDNNLIIKGEENAY